MDKYFKDFNSFVMNEKMIIKKDSTESFVARVVDAYEKAPIFDEKAVRYWNILNESNYTLFNRLLSKIDVIFVTEEKPTNDTITINDKEYKVIQSKDPYESQKQMKEDVEKNSQIYISIDHSKHPIFSVIDNIVFRTVHDYIVHILGNKPFGLFGELQAYNLHAKMVPVDARPAIFTEVVGQIAWYHIHNEFPVQKVAVLEGFDFVNVGL